VKAAITVLLYCNSLCVLNISTYDFSAVKKGGASSGLGNDDIVFTDFWLVCVQLWTRARPCPGLHVVLLYILDYLYYLNDMKLNCGPVETLPDPRFASAQFFLFLPSVHRSSGKRAFPRKIFQF
jgi:hypothetical protein